MGIDRGFNSAMNRWEFGFQIAAISATLGPRSRHNRATIGPRSWSSPFVDRLPIDWRRLPNERSAFAARSRRDRGSIGPRSSVLPRILRAVRYDDRYLMKIRRARAFHAASTEAVRSRSRDLPLMTIRRSSRRHLASGKPFDHLTYSSNSARGGFGDRVDRGSRDLSRRDQIRRPPCVHVACKRKPCGNIVPHGENQGEVYA